jgi:hypothetical protein
VLEQDNPVPQTWVGPAVASGTVTVEGTVNGVSAISDTARVNVSERGFTIPIDTGKAAAIDTTLDCFSTPVYGAGQKIWGWVRPPNRCDVVFNLPPLFPNPESSDTTGATIASVPSGPNRGLWYVSQFLTKLWLRAQVMKDLRSNAPTYLATTEDPVGIGCGVLPDSTKRFTTLYADTVCKQNNGGSQHLSYVWHHEGCHMARNSWVSTSDPATRVRFDSIDRAVFMDSASVRSRLTTLLIFVRDSSWNYGKRIDTDYPVVTYNVWTPSTANNGGWVLQAWPIQGTVEPNTLCR